MYDLLRVLLTVAHRLYARFRPVKLQASDMQHSERNNIMNSGVPITTVVSTFERTIINLIIYPGSDQIRNTMGTGNHGIRRYGSEADAPFAGL